MPLGRWNEMATSAIASNMKRFPTRKCKMDLFSNIVNTDIHRATRTRIAITKAPQIQSIKCDWVDSVTIVQTVDAQRNIKCCSLLLKRKIASVHAIVIVCCEKHSMPHAIELQLVPACRRIPSLDANIYALAAEAEAALLCLHRDCLWLFQNHRIGCRLTYLLWCILKGV